MGKLSIATLSMKVLADTSDMDIINRKADEAVAKAGRAGKKGAKGLKQLGDQSRKTTQAINALSFGVEDFVAVSPDSGFARGLMAASNNISMAARALLPAGSLFAGGIGIAVTAGASLWSILSKSTEETKNIVANSKEIANILNSIQLNIASGNQGRNSARMIENLSSVKGADKAALTATNAIEDADKSRLVVLQAQKREYKEQTELITKIGKALSKDDIIQQLTNPRYGGTDAAGLASSLFPNQNVPIARAYGRKMTPEGNAKLTAEAYKDLEILIGRGEQKARTLFNIIKTEGMEAAVKYAEELGDVDIDNLLVQLNTTHQVQDDLIGQVETLNHEWSTQKRTLESINKEMAKLQHKEDLIAQNAADVDMIRQKRITQLAKQTADATKADFMFDLKDSTANPEASARNRIFKETTDRLREAAKLFPHDASVRKSIFDAQSANIKKLGVEFAKENIKKAQQSATDQSIGALRRGSIGAVEASNRAILRGNSLEIEMKDAALQTAKNTAESAAALKNAAKTQNQIPTFVLTIP